LVLQGSGIRPKVLYYHHHSCSCSPLLGTVAKRPRSVADDAGCGRTFDSSSRVDAISNMATTLYCLSRHDEAEAQWLKAIQLRPDYLEAVEHLVAAIYQRKAQSALQVIQFVQQSLRIEGGRHPRGNGNDNDNGNTNTSSIVDDAHPESASCGYGSSGYALPGADNARIVRLIHAKATLLYGLNQMKQAADAFEEAVLICTGLSTGGIRTLMRKIQAALLCQDETAQVSGAQPQPAHQQAVHIRSLLLLPAQARRTAGLVFSGNGDLPGLRFVMDATKKRDAVSITSNSLLSMAKIFQDNMTAGSDGSDGDGALYNVADVLALYYLSLSLNESPSTANNVGILLASLQQSLPGTPQGSVAPHQIGLLQAPFQEVVGPAASPNEPGGGINYALEYYKYGLGLDPGHVHLLTNCGSLLKDGGMLDAAIEKYEQAVARDPNFEIALTNLASAVKDRGRVMDALVYYSRAVDVNPGFVEAVCGLSNTLSSVCDWNRRGGAYLKDGKYDRWHVGDNGELQDVLSRRRGSGVMQQVIDIVRQQLDEASQWGVGLLRRQHASAMELLASQACVSTDLTREEMQAKLVGWAGRPWEGSQVIRLVERATRAKTRQWYLNRYERRCVASKDAYLRPQLPAGLTMPPVPTVLPFHTFTCPLTAREIRGISQRNALRLSYTTLTAPWIPDTVYPPPRPPNPHLNIGYISSDFNDHPLAHLMQSVFGLHEPTKAKAHCYATTPSDSSVHRQQIEREAPVFWNVSGWSTHDIVDRILKDGIHILVNLNGYTRGSRSEVFAARPAPIQMSFMGFAGSMGAEWCDYLLADTTAIPRSTRRPYRGNATVQDLFMDGTYADNREGDDWVYSENIVYCRETFFCCDHAQSCDPSDCVSTWEDEQRQRWAMRKRIFPTLPDNFVILGNFNQLYKVRLDRSGLACMGCHVPTRQGQ